MTFKDYIDRLPKPVRDRVYANTMDDIGEKNFDTFCNKEVSNTDVLLSAFKWGSSPEGALYWLKVAGVLKNITEEK